MNLSCLVANFNHIPSSDITTNFGHMSYFDSNMIFSPHSLSLFLAFFSRGDADSEIYARKWAATIIVSSFTLISPVSSSMVAPALTSISKDFGITNEVESQLVLSIFILAYAIGPLFLGPLSEIYGRVPVLQLSNLVYLIFNLACGASRNKGQMIAFRFLSGLGGSAPLAVNLRVLDCSRSLLTLNRLAVVFCLIVGELKVILTLKQISDVGERVRPNIPSYLTSF